ncbi:MAG: hypothetical protein GY931_11510 [Maribacter sp.]|nr:hypothetical protein [Maribacter sp.]
MTKAEFSRLFDKLAVNGWKYPVEKSTLQQKKALYYSKLCEYEAKSLESAVSSLIMDSEQECFPSLYRVTLTIDTILESPKVGYNPPKPDIKTSPQRHDRITKLMKDTNELIIKYKGKPELYDKLDSLGKGFLNDKA